MLESGANLSLGNELYLSSDFSVRRIDTDWMFAMEIELLGSRNDANGCSDGTDDGKLPVAVECLDFAVLPVLLLSPADVDGYYRTWIRNSLCMCHSSFSVSEEFEVFAK